MKKVRAIRNAAARAPQPLVALVGTDPRYHSRDSRLSSFAVVILRVVRDYPSRLSFAFFASFAATLRVLRGFRSIRVIFAVILRGYPSRPSRFPKGHLLHRISARRVTC